MMRGEGDLIHGRKTSVHGAMGAVTAESPGAAQHRTMAGFGTGRPATQSETRVLAFVVRAATRLAGSLAGSLKRRGPAA